MNFGEILIKEEQIIAKSTLVFAFINIKPFLPYHILISPIKVVERFRDLTIEERNDLIAMISNLMNGLDSLGTAWNVNLQDGVDSGQTIPHVHFHLIPRNPNDLKRNNDIFEKLDIGFECKNKTIQEMKQEADFLREMLKKNGIHFE